MSKLQTILHGLDSSPGAQVLLEADKKSGCFVAGITDHKDNLAEDPTQVIHLPLAQLWTAVPLWMFQLQAPAVLPVRCHSFNPLPQLRPIWLASATQLWLVGLQELTVEEKKAAVKKAATRRQVAGDGIGHTPQQSQHGMTLRARPPTLYSRRLIKVWTGSCWPVCCSSCIHCHAAENAEAYSSDPSTILDCSHGSCTCTCQAYTPQN